MEGIQLMPEDYEEVREAPGGLDAWLYDYEWHFTYYRGIPSVVSSIEQVYHDWTLRADYPRNVYSYTHFLDWCGDNRFDPNHIDDTRQLSQNIDAWRMHNRMFATSAGLLERYAFGSW